MKHRATCPECSHQFDVPDGPLAGEASASLEPARSSEPARSAELASFPEPASFPELAAAGREATSPAAARPRRTAAGKRMRMVGATLLILLSGATVLLIGRPWRAAGRLAAPADGLEATRPEASHAERALQERALQERVPLKSAPLEAARLEASQLDTSTAEAGPAAEPEAARRVRFEKIERGIVKIESDGPGNLDSIGTGFVIDSSGLVATSYHVMSEHTQARATFRDGVSFPIAGYVAVAPEADLAIVQLGPAASGQPPSGLEAMRLRHADDPGRLAPVVAVGHPRGLDFSPYDGRVSRILTTSQLPAQSRRFLEQQLDLSTLDHRWIQHTAQISPGNSGGPLLDERGQVVGVNTWVDQGTGFSYALHARHLHDLWRDGPSELVPLDRFARPGARLTQLLDRLSPERLEQLVASAERMQWKPADQSDYERLQHLAWAITVAQLPGTLGRGEGLDPGQLDRLRDVTDRILKQLRGRRWDEPGQITIVNDYAARHVGRPLAGVFLFGTVERVVEGEDGTRACLMTLAGTDQTLLLPLDGQLIRLQPAAQCLVLGVNYNGHVVRYGDNPLRLKTADVIASRAILVLE